MSELPKPFSGELMTCCICEAQQQSDPGKESGWTIIELDQVRHYVCPAELPGKDASAGQFELAYKRVMKTILEKRAGNTTDATNATNAPDVAAALAPKRQCRKCGCTEERACVTDGRACYWVLPNLCSNCVPQFNERDLRHLDRVDFGLRLSGPEAFALLAALQLACRHPGFKAGPTHAMVLAVAELLQAQVSVTENLTIVAQAGWAVPTEPVTGGE